MSTFVVVHHLVTPMSLASLTSQQSTATRWKFDLQTENRQVLVQEFIGPYFGIRRTFGLDIYTRLEAPDATSAARTAEDVAATIYSLMCFQGRTFLEKMRLLSTLEVIDGVDDPFSYVIYDEPAHLSTESRVQIKDTTFQELWDADIALTASGTDRAKRKQLHLAMAMLRNGTAAGHQISQFLQYWIGIAALDHHLDAIESANGKAGWTAIFERHSLDYSKFRKARDQLMHPSSFSKLADAYQLALETMSQLEPVLSETVARLYSLQPTTVAEIMELNRLGPNESWSVISGMVEGVPSVFDDVPTQFAHFTSAPIQRVAEVADDDTVNVTYRLTHNADFGTGVRASITSLERHTLDASHIKKIGPTQVEMHQSGAI